jgi:pyruvate-formate lyase-activating enzyme
MEFIISNVKRRTFRDYPGVLATKLIFGECSLDCKNCEYKSEFYKMDSAEAEKLLDEEVDTSAVFIGGCEPLHQYDACENLAKIAKNKKLKVGINTLGLFENHLRELVKNRLVDFIKFELVPDKYGSFSKQMLESVKSSIGFVRASGVDYEFYLKLNDNMNPDEIEKVYRQVLPCNLFVLDRGHISESNLSKFVEFAKGKENVVLRFWD